MNKDAELMKNLLIQYIIDATQLGEELTKAIVEESNFYWMLEDDLEFVGKYSLEYWGKQILEETIESLTTKLKILNSK